MPNFDPAFVRLMRSALEEAMTRVPAEHATPAIKAHVAECILKAATKGQRSHDGLVDAARDQLPIILTLFT